MMKTAELITTSDHSPYAGMSCEWFMTSLRPCPHHDLSYGHCGLGASGNASAGRVEAGGREAHPGYAPYAPPTGKMQRRPRVRRSPATTICEIDVASEFSIAGSDRVLGGFARALRLRWAGRADRPPFRHAIRGHLSCQIYRMATSILLRERWQSLLLCFLLHSPV